MKESGYEAYLVGGGVRDLLLDKKPKDFDIATNATPEQIYKIFKNCRLIGRRFRLAHIYFGREIIEVATFRASHKITYKDQTTDEGMLLRDNIYGSIEEDALRRDFTVNALYYNIDDFSIVDYTNGINDLKNGIIRLIGEPEIRYREDPVRMIRAIRFMAKLGFKLETETEKSIPLLCDLIRMVPPARLFEEVLKLFMTGSASRTFEELQSYNLFAQLFPSTNKNLIKNNKKINNSFIWQGLHNTDKRIFEEKPVTPAFLFAILLWDPVRDNYKELEKKGMDTYAAIQKASSEVLNEQLKYVSLPKRFSLPMKEIWSLQFRFKNISEKKATRFVFHPRFRAAYDFLLLRTQMKELEPDLVNWWTKFQAKNSDLMESAREKRKTRY